MPKVNFSSDKICEACARGKQTRSSFKAKNIVSSSRPLKLLFLDLFGPTRTASLSGKSYGFVIVDDFSRFTWVLFLTCKSDALMEFKAWCRKVQGRKNGSILTIQSDNGGKFKNGEFEDFCNEEGIVHNFSSLRTPEQNAVVEPKNHTLVEMARMMLTENSLP